jgi:hypothetical protein
MQNSIDLINIAVDAMDMVEATGLNARKLYENWEHIELEANTSLDFAACIISICRGFASANNLESSFTSLLSGKALARFCMLSSRLDEERKTDIDDFRISEGVMY